MRQDDGADADQDADPEASHRRAVELAVSWLLAHPADPFDGGLAAVCAEIVALHALVSNPKLSASHAVIRRALRERIAALNALPNYRAQPDEYEMLVTAEHVAQQLDLELQTFEKTAKKLRLRARVPHRGRSGPEPLFLCTYLNRLQPADEVPCALEQSVLYQEYDSGQLPPLLEGPVDRQESPVVARVLVSIAADVFALSDYGHEDLGGHDVFSDGSFWSRLCEHGIRWGRETADVVLVAKLVLVAQVVGLEPGAGWLRDAVDYLVRHQEPDGSFGVTSSHGPNAFRDGVLAASMALSASL